MKGRWYLPENTGLQNVEFFKPCQNASALNDAPPFTVCTNNISGQYQYRQDIMSGYFRNATHVLTFDTEQALKAKICATHKAHVNTQFGIAAYDIDADIDQTASLECPRVEYKANYSRVRLLRRIVDFLRAHFHNQSTLTDCDSIR
ncbi:uncharacterized protein LOC144130170 [Amblyomma americanum]